MNDITKYMVPIMGMAIMAGVMQMVIPAPTPEPPPAGYKCPYCDLYFPTLDEVSDHVASTHPDEPPFIGVDIDWGQ